MNACMHAYIHTYIIKETNLYKLALTRPPPFLLKNHACLMFKKLIL